MKKLLMAALIVSTFATAAFAKASENTNRMAVKSFTSEFKRASNVIWASSGDYAKVTFTFNNQRMEAFYNESGEKIATSSGISLDELPLKAKRAFAKRYGNYTVKEAIDFEGFDEQAYFISAENDTESVVVKVLDSGEVSVFKKTKK